MLIFQGVWVFFFVGGIFFGSVSPHGFTGAFAVISHGEVGMKEILNLF